MYGTGVSAITPRGGAQAGAACDHRSYYHTSLVSHPLGSSRARTKLGPRAYEVLLPRTSHPVNISALNCTSYYDITGSVLNPGDIFSVSSSFHRTLSIYNIGQHIFWGVTITRGRDEKGRQFL